MIPYTLVSMAAILRDWYDLEETDYVNVEHEYLTSIADYLYNVGDSPEKLLPEYKKVYDDYGPDYFAKVIKYMESLDSQVTDDRKAKELLDNYVNKANAGVYATTKVTATEDNSYAHNLVKIAGKDARYVLDNLNDSHKTLGTYGAPGDAGYYVSEFEAATPGFMWASDTGLQILDDNGISYELIKEAIDSSMKILATSDNSYFSPDTFDVYNALLPYIGKYSSTTGWTGSCELQKVEDSSTVDGYTYKVIWDDSHNETDTFSWHVDDNPRVGGDYDLMVLPAHGMPIFCDTPQDFYRAVRKVFGDGLKKIGD